MEIKSQHELTTAGSRQSDVLIEALKKCQELEAENKALKEKVVLLEEDVEHWKASCKRLEDHQRQGVLF